VRTFFGQGGAIFRDFVRTSFITVKRLGVLGEGESARSNFKRLVTLKKRNIFLHFPKIYIFN